MTHLLPLLSALERAGCDVHLLCLGDGGLADEARRRGLSVSVLPMAGARDPRVLRPLRRLLAAGPAAAGTGGAKPAGAKPGDAEPADAEPAAPWDVVHTHGMRANLPVRLALRGLRGRPCLFMTVHSDLRLDYGSAHLARVYQGLDRATLGGVDGIICVSDSLRCLLIARGYPAERLITVRSGLESPAGGGSSVCGAGQGAEGAAAWGDPASVAPATPVAGGTAARRPRVGTAARLVAVKDIDLTLEVADRLRRTHPQVEMIIVGDGPERNRLEGVATSLGLDEIVRFTGRLAEIGTVMGGLDVYLVTSLFEGGVSMSVLEAMAAGVPVVTTAAGGVEEAVVDGETGYVVTRDQERAALAAALAERAAALLADPELRARMGAAGARRVREQFTVEQTAARTLRIYERCLAARSEWL
jgi:glycosyltransferase involved in cell wall biosynthesis